MKTIETDPDLVDGNRERADRSLGHLQDLYNCREMYPAEHPTPADFARELRSTISADLFFGRESLGDTNASDLLGFRFCQRTDLCGLLDGALIICLTLVGLHVDAQFRFCNAGLHLGAGFRLAEFTFFHGSLLLSSIGFHLFGGNLT